MKEQIKNIIESYCEGISHLEFNIADLDKMADEILALQLQQTGVVGRSEQLCGNLDENYECKNMCLTRCVNGYKFYK